MSEEYYDRASDFLIKTVQMPMLTVPKLCYNVHKVAFFQCVE